MTEIATIGPANAVKKYTAGQIDLIRRQLAQDCTDDEFYLYMEMAKRSGLDPIRRQIYAIVHNPEKKDRRKMTIITGIDGYRAIANRSGTYRPDDGPPLFEYNDSLKGPLNPIGMVSATVRAWKRCADGWYAVAGTAYWEEYAPTRPIWRNGQRTEELELVPGNWVSKPRVMLAKCAEAQALRRGWPEDVSGMYTEDEMTTMEILEQRDLEKRLAITNSDDCITIMWTPDKPLENVPVGRFFDAAAQHVNAMTEAHQLHGWRETNRVALQSFWARAKTDALELKKIIEAKERELSGSVSGK